MRSAGCGWRVAGCEVRGAGCEVRVAGCELRGAGLSIWDFGLKKDRHSVFGFRRSEDTGLRGSGCGERERITG